MAEYEDTTHEHLAALEQSIGKLSAGIKQAQAGLEAAQTAMEDIDGLIKESRDALVSSPKAIESHLRAAVDNYLKTLTPEPTATPLTGDNDAPMPLANAGASETSEPNGASDSDVPGGTVEHDAPSENATQDWEALATAGPDLEGLKHGLDDEVLGTRYEGLDTDESEFDGVSEVTPEAVTNEDPAVPGEPATATSHQSEDNLVKSEQAEPSITSTGHSEAAGGEPAAVSTQAQTEPPFGGEGWDASDEERKDDAPSQASALGAEGGSVSQWSTPGTHDETSSEQASATPAESSSYDLHEDTLDHDQESGKTHQAENSDAHALATEGNNSPNTGELKAEGLASSLMKDNEDRKHATAESGKPKRSVLGILTGKSS